MEELVIPVETPLGTISGRDAIFLDSVEYSIAPDTLILAGDFNSALCSTATSDAVYVAYEISFSDVIYLQVVELDVDPRALEHESSFDIIQNSRLIDSFRSRDFDKKVTDKHQQFSFCTYDHIFEIVASGFDLKIGDSRPKTP